MTSSGGRHRAARSFLLGFAAAFLALSAMLIAEAVRYPVLDDGRGYLAAGSDAGVRNLLALKAAHGRAAARYRIGLFGNSRSVAVSAADLGLEADLGLDAGGTGGGDAPAAFFNFSVGGTEFLQSVALIEALAEAGKVPDLVLISLDHPRLHFTGYPYYPYRALDPVGFATALWAEMRLGLARDMPWGTVARAVAGEAADAVRQLADIWSVDTLRRRLATYWRREGDCGGCVRQYRPDGSRPLVETARAAALAFQPGTPSPATPLRLAAAQHRLRALMDRHGFRAIVYESPLLPPLQAGFAATPDAAATALHEAFRRECAALALTCVPAPLLEGGAEGWSDCCHAPAPRLGRFLAGLVRDAGAGADAGIGAGAEHAGR